MSAPTVAPSAMTTPKPLRVLLVDSDNGRIAQVGPALRRAGCDVVLAMKSIDGLDERLRQLQPDLIVIHSDAPDAEMLGQLSVLMQDQPRPIVLFAQTSDRDTTAAAIRAGVSAYVVAGWDPARLQPILDAAVTRFQQFQSLRKELAATRSQLAERKRIERAKGILMRNRGMSEDEAYQALRKLAMNKNKRLVDIAESVIAASELLG